MMQDASICIRNTFIDGDAHHGNVQLKTRSHSVPAGNCARHVEGPDSDTSDKCQHHLISWIERAQDFPHSHLLLEDHTLGKENSPTKADQAVIVVTNMSAVQEGKCSCGVAFKSNAQFCHGCGLAKPHVKCSCGSEFKPGARFCYKCGRAKCDVEHSTSLRFGEECTATLPITFENSFTRSNSCCSLKSLGQDTDSTIDSPRKRHDSPTMSRRQSKASTIACECQQCEMSLEQSGSCACRTHPAPQMSDATEAVTTLMLCDIPCRQNIGQVIEAMNMKGFANTYDLVYMKAPRKGYRRPKSNQNFGYAFVNFKRPEYATAFQQVFFNFSFPGCKSAKLSYAKPAHCQGFHKNSEMHSKYDASGCFLTFLD